MAEGIDRLHQLRHRVWTKVRRWRSLALLATVPYEWWASPWLAKHVKPWVEAHGGGVLKAVVRYLLQPLVVPILVVGIVILLVVLRAYWETRPVDSGKGQWTLGPELAIPGWIPKCAVVEGGVILRLQTLAVSVPANITCRVEGPGKTPVESPTLASPPLATSYGNPAIVLLYPDHFPLAESPAKGRYRVCWMGDGQLLAECSFDGDELINSEHRYGRRREWSIDARREKDGAVTLSLRHVGGSLPRHLWCSIHQPTGQWSLTNLKPPIVDDPGTANEHAELVFPRDFEHATDYPGLFSVLWRGGDESISILRGGLFTYRPVHEQEDPQPSLADPVRGQPVVNVTSPRSEREVGRDCRALAKRINSYLTDIQSSPALTFLTIPQAQEHLRQVRANAADAYRTDFADKVLALRDQIVCLGHEPNDLDVVLDEGVGEIPEIARVALILSRWGETLIQGAS